MVWSGNTLVGDSVTLDPYMALGHATTQFGRHAPAPGPHLCAHAAAAYRAGAGAGGVSQHAAADEADWADESLAIRCQRLPRRRGGATSWHWAGASAEAQTQVLGRLRCLADSRRRQRPTHFIGNTL